MGGEKDQTSESMVSMDVSLTLTNYFVNHVAPAGSFSDGLQQQQTFTLSNM